MNPAATKEIEDFLRSMRQAFNTQDMKAYRQHYWTNSRFRHIDASGRMDEGWGAFEEVTAQEFRYLDSVELSMRNPEAQIFDDRFASVITEWRLVQVDPGGRAGELGGKASFTLVKFGKNWKIVTSHFTALETVPEEG